MAARQLRLSPNSIGRPGRRLDWQAALTDYVGWHLHVPFAWGHCDCCLWAAGWAEVCTGRHPAADLVGTYRTSAAAQAIIQREGGFVAMVTARMLSEPLASPLAVMRGDMAAVPGESVELPALGIIIGASIAVMTPGAGLVRVPVTQATHAWAIG